jgi:hypothetical protein
MQMKLSPSRLLSALGALLATGALASALGGCGASSATLDPVAQAAEVTSATGGVQMRLEMSLSIPGLGSPVTATGHGYFNYKAHEGELAIDMNGLPSSATEGLGGGPVHVEELMKSTTIYVGSPLFAGRLPGGAHWMKVDLKKLGGLAGIDVQSLISGESNPAQFLEYLHEHGGSVHTLGGAMLHGVHTTRYRGAIDLHQIAQTLPESQRGAAQAEIEKLASQIGLSSIPFEVWVDDQHRVRRIELNISINAAGQQGGMRLTIDLSGYGATPKVTVPADSEVFSAPTDSLSSGG